MNLFFILIFFLTLFITKIYVYSINVISLIVHMLNYIESLATESGDYYCQPFFGLFLNYEQNLITIYVN